MTPAAQLAVCFKPASGQGFAAASEELQGLLELAVKEAGSTLRGTDDRYGYRWVVLADPEMEDLVTSVHLVNSTLEEYGFGPQLLCSVFAFADASGRRFHLVYLYKRGTFYPFAPLGGERRDNELEVPVKARLGRGVGVSRRALLAAGAPLPPAPPRGGGAPTQGAGAGDQAGPGRRPAGRAR